MIPVLNMFGLLWYRISNSSSNINSGSVSQIRSSTRRVEGVINSSSRSQENRVLTPPRPNSRFLKILRCGNILRHLSLVDQAFISVEKITAFCKCGKIAVGATIDFCEGERCVNIT